MTKKDYIAGARIFAQYTGENQWPYKVTGQALIREVINKFADMYYDDSGRFDRARFLKAWGVEE